MPDTSTSALLKVMADDAHARGDAYTQGVCLNAIEEISALRKALETTGQALEPFATHVLTFHAELSDDAVIDAKAMIDPPNGQSILRAAEFRAAQRALVALSSLSGEGA